jgi:serine/threonine-protein kinase
MSMMSSTSSETVFRPLEPGTRTPPGETRPLSDEILKQSARRLRILALMYAFTYFMSSFPGLVLASNRVVNIVYWVPDLLSILTALAVAAITLSSRVRLAVVLNLGLVFLVVSNFGIAIGEFIDPRRLDMNGWIGLSWVAVWTPLFTVVIPTRPRKALIATIASVSSVPLVIGWMVVSRRTVFQPSADQFFFFIVFPYILIVGLAYAGQVVVYALGKEASLAQELGSYRLIERLGQGGMGEVWRATHLLLARPAAIKLLRTSRMGEGEAATDALLRFQREARVTAQLRSPHTVELWDFGIAGDGRFYYVMELLDGLDLEKLVKRHGPLPAARVIHLLRQVCHSLAEAEERGLVHRDIKPSNILVCRYGSDHDFVKVLDFGIVKVSPSTPLDTDVVATRDHLFRGTPAFIAPEQVLGDAIDSRADIYATGCVAYWLLTGELVFTAETPMAVMLLHAQTKPTPPSQRTELPIAPELEGLIMECLAKDPAARPQTARELSERLGRIAVGETWSEARAREWWASHEPARA